jgi:hypothetical protein
MRSVIAMFCIGLVFGYLVAGIEASKVAPSSAPAVHEVPADTVAHQGAAIETAVQNVPQETYRTVSLGSAGMRFAYRLSPDGYIIDRMVATNTPDAPFLDGYQLVRVSDATTLRVAASDGVPTINILVMKNPDKLSPRVWAIQNPQLSNANSVRGDMHDETFGTESAVTYTTDGLYTMEYHVVSVGKYMYILSGSYDGEASPLLQDFHTFLSKFEFIPVQ